MCQLPPSDSTQSLVIYHTFYTVLAFLSSHKVSVSRIVEVALALCKNARLTSLPQAMSNIIFGQYESLVRSTPWDRHPITVNLKEIYATLIVCIFRGFALPWTELIFI